MVRRPGPDGGPIAVLESFGPPHPRTNPYLVQLVASLPESVAPLWFSWSRALAGDFDVLHVHWPEVLVRDPRRLRRGARCVALALVLARLRLTGRALVRTLHNETPHEPLSAPQRLAVRLADRGTTLWITLAPDTVPPTGAPVVVAPIGHDRDRLAAARRAAGAPVPGRLLHFGLVRRYKGVGPLLDAFTALDDPALSLHVVGDVLDPASAAALASAARRDRRLRVVDRYVPEDQLVAEILAAELVVLPFARFTNSSSLILALSLDRPVLVPRSTVTGPLAAEVGPAWVLTYDPPLGPDDLVRALAAARRAAGGAPPDLAGRAWPDIGARHAAAFAEARSRARRTRGWRRGRSDGTAGGS